MKETPTVRKAKYSINFPLLSMALPGIIFLFCFAYLPMFGIIIAFKNYKYDKGIFFSEWVGWDNFKFLFATNEALQATYNTLLMNTLFIVFGTIAAIILALMLNEIKNKVINVVFQSALFFPYLLSWVIVSYMVYAVLDANLGLINKLLIQIGINPIQWYTEAKYWPGILTLVTLWKGAGYTSIIYLSGMLGISHDYYEAARIDGANKWQQITRITLPLITPLITIMTLMAIGRIFYADFGLFYTVPRDIGFLRDTTEVIDTYVYRMFRATGDTGMASAAGFYQSVVGFVLVFGSNWIVKKINSDNSLF